MWAGVRLPLGHVLAAEPAEVGVLSLEDTSLPSNNCQELFSPDRAHRLLQPHSGQVGASPARMPVLARLPKTPPAILSSPTFPFKVTACLQRLQPQVSEAHSFLPPSSPFVEYQVSQVGIQGAGASCGVLKEHPWPPQPVWYEEEWRGQPGSEHPLGFLCHFPSLTGMQVPLTAAVGVVGASLGCQPDAFFQGANPGCFG